MSTLPKAGGGIPGEELSIPPPTFDPGYNLGGLTALEGLIPLSLSSSAMSHINRALDSLNAQKSGPSSLSASHASYATRLIPG